MTKNVYIPLILLFCISASAQQQEKKLTVAVLNLKPAAGVSKGEADIISDRLRIELFKTGNVEVMEREQMQTILTEQGFQASGACSDEGCMVEMGQMLGVQRMITGSIGRLGNLYLLNFRSIDVTTGIINKVVSEDIDGKLEEVVCRLSYMAWMLTATGDQKIPKPPARPVKTGKKKAKPVPPKVKAPPAAPLPGCRETVFLEQVNFSNKISFKIEKETYEEINSDIKDAIEEAVEEEIDDDLDVEILTTSQIKQLPRNCKSGLARAVLVSYSTEKSGTQFIGKIKIVFYFYATPHHKKPTFKITIEEEGDRHWGDQVPLMNAIEEVADELEESLEDSDYIDCLDPEKK